MGELEMDPLVELLERFRQEDAERDRMGGLNVTCECGLELTIRNALVLGAKAYCFACGAYAALGVLERGDASDEEQIEAVDAVNTALGCGLLAEAVA